MVANQARRRPNRAKPGEASANRTERVSYRISAIIITLVVVLAGLYLLTTVFHIIPARFSGLTYAVIVGVTIYAILRIVTRILEAKLSRFVERSTVRPIMLIVELVGYFIITLFVLSALGINTSSVLLSGTIIGAVVGLASQNVLSNIFGGIMLIFARPFMVGDRVSISTWQYGVMLTLTPPKYFSRDEVKNGYTGVIEDLTLLYTTLRESTGEYIKIPNSIVVQAAVSKIPPTSSVKVRYEVPKSIKFGSIQAKVAKAVKDAASLKKLPEIIVEETTVSTYLMLISFDCESERSAHAKSAVLQRLIDVIEPLKTK